MKKTAAIIAIALATASHSYAVDQSQYWKSDQMAEGMRNCTFSEALVSMPHLKEAQAFGMNIEGPLGIYCSELMGFMWRCEMGKNSTAFCADIALSFAREGIEKALALRGR